MELKTLTTCLATAGKGQTVGIVDAYSYPTAESDLATYRKQFKLPLCTIKNGCLQILNKQAKPPLPPPDPNWSGEMALDLDMASAICPNCHIVLVEANSSRSKDLGASVRTAAAAGAGQISNSYGGAECSRTNSGKVSCLNQRSYAKFYTIPNTIITASSTTTHGSTARKCRRISAPSLPSAVRLYPYSNSRGWLESAWGDAAAGARNSSPTRAGSRHRSVVQARSADADVSAVADPLTGVLVYETYPSKKGYYYIVGGTSASSPIIASVYALAGNAASQKFGSLLYKAPKGALTDVTIGRNGVVGLTNAAGQACTPIAICNATARLGRTDRNGYALGARRLLTTPF